MATFKVAPPTTPTTQPPDLSQLPSQPGFFNVVVQPLYSSAVAVFPAMAPVLSAVQDNCTMWAEEMASAAAVAAVAAVSDDAAAHDS